MSSVNSAVKNEAPWQAGLHSLRVLLVPGLILQAVAIALVLAYYFVPATGAVFAELAHWQTAGGIAFSTASTVLCGGVLPFLFLRWHPGTRAANPWPHLVFYLVFWAWKGAEVDLWYRTLSWLYGHDHTVGIIVKKVLSDQLGYNPLYATPISLVCFGWKDAGFRWAPVAADLRAGRWYARRVLPVLIAVWFIWLPVVTCVYSLPEPLQMPLFNVVLCFWSMLFAHITARQNQADPAGIQQP